MASTLAKPPVHQRHSSRPDSASSSSIATTQRTSSYNSRNGIRPAISGLRTQSSNEATSIPSNLSNRTLSPETTKRRSSAFHARPDSGNGFREGVGNLNRWSQSTASSKSSATHNRRSSFSRRLSGSFGSFGGFSGGPTPSPNATFVSKGRSPKRKAPSEPSSNMATSAATPPPILPPIVTLSSLSQAVDAADTPSTAATATPVTADIISPSNVSSTENDYFGHHVKSRTSSGMATGVKRQAPVASPRANKPSSILVDQSTSPSSTAPGSTYSPRTAARLRHTDRRRISQNNHHRHRDNSGKSSGTTEGESSASDNRATVERPQKRKAHSQKAILSKALQKAHHAVTLDQHSNYEGAMHAYQEACSLLQKVMVRSSGIEDRLKLEAVRNTYEARIAELRGIDSSYQNVDSKALPQRPPDRDSKDSEERLSIVTDTDEAEAILEMASAQPVGRGQQQNVKHPHLGTLGQAPARRQSMQVSPHPDVGRDVRAPGQTQGSQPLRTLYHQSQTMLEPPMRQEDPVLHACMPPPLSPRRPRSPAAPPPQESTKSSTDPSATSALSDGSDSFHQEHEEHTSWLNTINESSGSSSSVHSRRSSIGLRRKHIRATSGQTEAEFDAALDAAVEAAYDDGFEPDDEGEDDEQLLNDPVYGFENNEHSSPTKDNELAKENAREAERERVIVLAKDRERQRLQNPNTSVDTLSGDDADDDEERMLEEMTRDYILDDSEYDIQTKSALPRQSDSSGFSGRTWVSSIGSNPTSAGTSLSTVAEALVLPSMDTHLKDNPLPPPVHPPPSVALPPPPVRNSAAPSPKVLQQAGSTLPRPTPLTLRNTSPGVRDRRLSGTKRKPLKIETNTKLPNAPEFEAPRTQPSLVPPSAYSASTLAEPPKTTSALSDPTMSRTFNSVPTPTTLPESRKGSSPMPRSESPEAVSSTASALTKLTAADSDNSTPSIPGSPARVGAKATTGLRKNYSSSSLKNKSLKVAGPDPVDGSSNASVSSVSSTPKQHKVPSPAVPALPTPIDTNFISKSQSMGGIYLFDNDIHSPLSPGSPNPLASNPPLPLEPCPESAILRPFWFLRSIYHTIAHPRGGYISNRLFVPRDIWRVKNVKLKNVEEKVSSCDMLTAALLKLGKVDTLDANAVYDEMTSFETIIEQVQANLSKKLGNDVGVSGASQSFKGMSTSEDNPFNPEIMGSKTNLAGGKSYLSWGKLRPKNSRASGATSIVSLSMSKDGSKDAPRMKSLPMTTTVNPRFPKRDVNQVQCVGSNPSYMGALARLCDAAQILDSILRQVEDPGLKFSSQIHTGIELSAHRIAEFFGFFVCRFIFTDIGIMLNKFIKRASEWVSA